MATNFTQISYENIKAEVESFLRKIYNKASVLYDVSSPFGQLLSVINHHFNLSTLYLKRSIDSFDLSNTASNNKRLVNTAAIIAGHNPGRAISATGTLRLKVKSTSNVERDIPGGRITINNKTRIRNKTNGLDYSIDLGGMDVISYPVQSGTQFYMPIIQGKWEIGEFTGTGETLQSFSLNIPNGNKDVENFNVQVSVNGELWPLRKNLYEMGFEEKLCIVRTGFNGGIDIVFGNGDFGAIPIIGSVIKVNYILSDGSRGSIFRRTQNDFRIIDDVLDGFGNTIDITQFFDIYISTDINFGADSESVKFTRNIMPIASTNYVLALPEQYAYYIKRLGVFSHVNAYESYGKVIIVATPNIKLFRNENRDYFSIDKGAFVLDSYEKSKIDKYLKTSGTIQLSKRYEITSPNLSQYIINVFLIVYSDAIMENVQNQIYDKISEYFLDFNRIDRVPKKDIINKLSEIEDIDSVDITFISKKNEDYHGEFIKQDNNIRNTKFASIQNIFDPKKNPRYNPNESRGLDPILGDIVFEPNEIPVIRAGFSDRNGIFFADSIDGSGLGSVNIIKNGTTDRKNKNL
jgi:hypothetical protein